MARPLAKAIDYFPFDVHFFEDPKLRLIKGEFGLKGVITTIYLLCEVYGGEGYYVKFGDEERFLLADKIGGEVSPNFISEVLGGCLRRGIFDRAVYEMSGVLTSKGIQRRYVRAVSTRTEIRVESAYWLLDSSNADDVPEWIVPKIKINGIVLQRNKVDLQNNESEKENNSQSKRKKIKEKKTEADAFVVFADGSNRILRALMDFAAARAEAKKPMGDIAKDRLCRKLEKLINDNRIRDREGYIVDVLDRSILSGWQGVFHDPDFQDHAPAKSVSREPVESIDVQEDSNLADLL